MAEEKLSLHVDSDWKKQAQEEKKRLAEQEAQRKAAAPVGPAGVVAAGSAAPSRAAATAPATAAAPREREMPSASIETLVQTLVTQALFYMGELSTRSGQVSIDLDMARHQIDTLSLLEEKTANNLTPEEKSAMDHALYQTRMRFVNVSSQYIPLP